MDLERLRYEFQRASEVQTEEASRLRRARQALQDAEAAQLILQTAAKEVQETVHRQLATVVSECLSAVFDEPYQFKIVFDRHRGKTSARLAFFKGDLEFDPAYAVGGGVLDVASFTLWVACLMTKRPAPRRLLVADEPFRMLSKRYASRMAECLERLADEMNIQFVIVTHDYEFQIGKVIEIK